MTDIDKLPRGMLKEGIDLEKFDKEWVTYVNPKRELLNIDDLTTFIEKYVLGKYEKAAFRIAMLIRQEQWEEFLNQMLTNDGWMDNSDDDIDYEEMGYTSEVKGDATCECIDEGN
jgi:hypothetical protein